MTASEQNEALETIHDVKILNKIARDYGEHPVQVCTWKKEFQQQTSKLFEQKRGLKPFDPIEKLDKF
ncbi:hypothetical protein [Chlorobium limicola]